jgi:hypothetical protein
VKNSNFQEHVLDKEQKMEGDVIAVLHIETETSVKMQQIW